MAQSSFTAARLSPSVRDSPRQFHNRRRKSTSRARSSCPAWWTRTATSEASRVAIQRSPPTRRARAGRHQRSRRQYSKGAGRRHHHRQHHAGSGHLLSGQTVYLKLKRRTDDRRPGHSESRRNDRRWNEDGQRHQSPPDAAISRNPAKSAALVREQFIKAVEYRDKIQRADGDPQRCRHATCDWKRLWKCSTASASCTITPIATTTS